MAAMDLSGIDPDIEQSVIVEIGKDHRRPPPCAGAGDRMRQAGDRREGAVRLGTSGTPSGRIRAHDFLSFDVARGYRRIVSGRLRFRAERVSSAGRHSTPGATKFISRINGVAELLSGDV
jgi:hypothetical protein